MIKQVVIWKLQDKCFGPNLGAIKANIKTKLEELNGNIPGLESIVVCTYCTFRGYNNSCGIWTIKSFTKGGFEMDVKDIITKVAGNKDLLDKLKSADVKQAKELLDKAGVKVDEADVKKVKDALADGKIDMKEIKDIAGGIFK